MPIFRRATATGLPSPAPSTAPAAAGEAAAGARRGAATYIALGTRIKGEVSGTTDVQIEGEIAGEVRVEALVVVGPGGSVLGPLHGKGVRVSGQVAGNVIDAERVEVSAGGSVEGDIAAPRVVIAEGAFFKGKIEMKSDQNPEPRPAATAAVPAPDTAAAQQPRNAEAAEAGSE